ncbi:peptidoglycan DD-metalloendopeptidase family protein, partial [Candidatus Sumerlaeota bacterium]|nr:peptidoglycan DD-metalloendopeptidase family protein [Candidatus Sumerlaeota bacterium]
TEDIPPPVVVTRRGDTIDIETHPGAVVRAPRPGEVIYAGALEGFGQVVILDHGEGLLSVAASLDGVAVDVGDRVAAGQAVATAGVLRESGLPGLHFEVRRGSDVLDAVDWLGGENAVGSLLRP